MKAELKQEPFFHSFIHSANGWESKKIALLHLVLEAKGKTQINNFQKKRSKTVALIINHPIFTSSLNQPTSTNED
jgi:hypothetical protein